ncbi:MULTISPECIES: class I SAM-dependent methyltransferase [unclassified Roseibium]|uniref:class I SAM-dependent methyltransferase n=1 Tax=unclassified Roseibium TaxID=2629323 RepID=UPI00273E87F0|nr:MULTISPECIES: class I SAM-dependent methyltransferase [unclassified Roseibium]
MNTEKLGKSRLMNFLARLGGIAMESRLRHLLFDPVATLRDAGLKPGQTVLEVGCGTGFYTLPAARILGNSGHFIAMDPLTDYVKRVRLKVDAAGLQNVDVIQHDALQTGLEEGCADLVLLLGVLPFPTLPLEKLLPEMHRVLKPDGQMGIWLFPTTAGVPGAIEKSGMFFEISRNGRVYRYARMQS